MRETDVGARWGGDEFAVLAPNTSGTAAVALAERIRARIPRHGGPGWTVTGSIGVATFDPAASDQVPGAAALMRLADAAMYAAKRHGRNAVVTAAASSAEEGTGGRDRGRGAVAPLLDT